MAEKCTHPVLYLGQFGQVRILAHPGNFDPLNYTLLAIIFEKITFGVGWGTQGKKGIEVKLRSIEISSDFYVP